MNRRDVLTMVGLAVAAATLFIGCGESQQNFKDPNDLPPISADALADIQDQDRAIEDAERAESAKLGGSTARPKKR